MYRKARTRSVRSEKSAPASVIPTDTLNDGRRPDLGVRGEPARLAALISSAVHPLSTRFALHAHHGEPAPPPQAPGPAVMTNRTPRVSRGSVPAKKQIGWREISDHED